MSGTIPAPALIYCKSYYIYYKSYPTSNPRRAPRGGRRTSPACGSFRRPLNYNAGMNEGGVIEGGVSEGGGTCAQSMRTQSMRTCA